MARVLYRSGRIHAHPDASALVTDDELVAWIGDDAREAGTVDATVDLDGAWLAPAFVDAHVHTTSTGLALTGLDLTETTSLAHALRLLADHCRAQRGGVVLGTGWDETRWPEHRPPTAAELDRASFGGVVYLARTDVHSAVASSALLAAVPEVRSLPGFLGDGLVRQEAHHAVRRTASEAVTGAQRRSAQRAALDRFAALGIACVHECGGPDINGEDDFTGLLALEHPVERIGYWGELDAIEKARDLGAVGAAGDLFVDGALGSHTACLSAAYADEDTVGAAYLDAQQVAGHVLACTKAGLQAGFHAIGDAALQAVADGFATVADTAGLATLRAARHRVEHVEMLSAGQLAVLVDCGVTASVQPAFDARWGGPEGMYAARLGVARALAMNPLAAMRAAGMSLALGSDTPVTPPDPWAGVRAAVAHRTPGSALSIADAFAAHTAGGWQAAGRPGHGELRRGGPATFVVWDESGPLVDGFPQVLELTPVARTTVICGRAAGP